jgi:hypothetical protein
MTTWKVGELVVLIMTQTRAWAAFSGAVTARKNRHLEIWSCSHVFLPAVSVHVDERAACRMVTQCGDASCDELCNDASHISAPSVGKHWDGQLIMRGSFAISVLDLQSDRMLYAVKGLMTRLSNVSLSDLQLQSPGLLCS